MRLKGKKVRSKAGGQKFFSWSKIRALGQQQLSKHRATSKGSGGGGGSKKKGKKKNAKAAKQGSGRGKMDAPTATENCQIAMDVVARLRDEEHQCDVLMRVLGRDENAPAVAMDEITMKRALYTVR